MNTITTDTVELTLDGRPHRVRAGTTLGDLVAQIGHRPPEVGTAVNGAFIARSERAAHVLSDGDAVLFFQPIVAG